ncbi:MAG: hypothetical protein BWY71_02069 [Planctomycetes bacterium ADurb.Bin412]|nr:MAG: hypothetical protein BWY71_02069 [Planctomycetes bacterium ADurb.Bin412]
MADIRVENRRGIRHRLNMVQHTLAIPIYGLPQGEIIGCLLIEILQPELGSIFFAAGAAEEDHDACPGRRLMKLIAGPMSVGGIF